MEFQPLSVPAIDFCGARYADPPAFVVICPKRAVSPADGAIARRRRLRNAVEAPAYLTAMTRTFDHFAVSILLISSNNLADFHCKLVAQYDAPLPRACAGTPRHHMIFGWKCREV
jgi:hypothetical protein